MSEKKGNFSLSSEFAKAFAEAPESLDERHRALHYLTEATAIIVSELGREKAPIDIIRPWATLSNALLDTIANKPHPLFGVKYCKNPGLLSTTHGLRAIAALAISHAPKLEMQKVCKSAARMLGMSSEALWNYRDNLMKGPDGPVKDRVAQKTYQDGMQGRYLPPRGTMTVEMLSGKRPIKAMANDWLRHLKELIDIEIKGI